MLVTNDFHLLLSTLYLIYAAAVPILLSLGVGTQNLAQTGADPLAGFGIVTLASILPVFFVLVYGCIVSATVDVNSVINRVAVNATASALDLPGVGEIVSGIRSTAPLAAALILLVTFLLRTKLPALTFEQIMESDAPVSSGAAAVVMVDRSAFGRLLKLRFKMHRLVKRMRLRRMLRSKSMTFSTLKSVPSTAEIIYVPPSSPASQSAIVLGMLPRSLVCS